MKLLIADDHPIFRKGLKDIIQSSFPKSEIIESNNGKDALDVIKNQDPYISILDINMPELNGLEVSKIAIKEMSGTKIIILTMYKEKEMIRKALLLGVYGYVLKDFAETEIIECIKRVISDQKYIGPGLNVTVDELLQEDKKKQKILNLIKNLSQAELKTLKLVNQNKSTKEISELLFLSEKTVENYRSKICQKLGLPPRNNSLILWINEHKELLSSISEF